MVVAAVVSVAVIAVAATLAANASFQAAASHLERLLLGLPKFNGVFNKRPELMRNIAAPYSTAPPTHNAFTRLIF